MSFGPTFDDVLAAAQTGAGWARSRLYEWLAPAVTGYARAQGVRDAADLTGDVFVAVLQRLPSFTGGEDAFRRWVFTIAYRRIVDDRRLGARRPTNGDPVATRTAPAAEELALGRLGSERVAALLASLTDDQRQVLALRVVADLGLEQVAEITGKPLGAVKSLQHRALAALRRELHGEAVSR